MSAVANEPISPGGDVIASSRAAPTRPAFAPPARSAGRLARHQPQAARGRPDDDARFARSRARLGAEVVELDGRGPPRPAPSKRRPLADRSLQVRRPATAWTRWRRSVPARLAGAATGINKCRAAATEVHPLLLLGARRRGPTAARRKTRLPRHATNPDTKCGPIRAEILPPWRRALHQVSTRILPPRLAREDAAAGARRAARRPSAQRVDLAAAFQAGASTHASGSSEARSSSRARSAGARTIRSDLRGLRVRGWKPGDRLAGRRRKIQDVFVDAKVPRSEREAWPLVVRGDEVLAVPGLVEHPEVEAVRG